MDGATDGVQRAAARATRAGHTRHDRPRRRWKYSGHLQRTGRIAPGRNGSAAGRSTRDQAMRRLRRIKILATLGPASSDSATIRKLFEAGADVFRINMSHTPHDKMRDFITTIRNIESNYGRPIGVLVDLQGPKLRIGSFADGAIQLNNGDTFTLDT